MIDTKELRRLTQAALVGPDGISLNWIKLLQNFQQKVSPAAVSELLDRLEAAEKEGDTMRTKISDLTINAEYLGNLKKSYEELIGELQDDRDALRAKIEAMEQQAPVAWISAGGDVARSKAFMDEMGFACAPLYLAPGAKGE